MQINRDIIFHDDHDHHDKSKTDLAILSFTNLYYSITMKQTERDPSGHLMRERSILTNLTGLCLPGEITAILGASGAGKTSLLNILAGRISHSKNGMLKGELMANKQIYDSQKFSKFASYVMQNDVLFGTLTVRESFQFVANLKYADFHTKEQKVQEALKLLKLGKCADTLIGTAFQSGVSGGERKRTSIGVELIRDPFCILLDEPTSGLDSFTAFIIINLLRKIAKEKNRTIVFTIHQPSSDIFNLFDKVMFLLQGRFIYQGPSNQLVNYFASIGYQCPSQTNPLDFVMEISREENPKQANFQVLFNSYERTLHPHIVQEIDKIELTLIDENMSETSFCFQVAQICKRGLINVRRDKLLIRGRLVMVIFLGLFIGGVFYGVGQKEMGLNAMQSRIGTLFFLVASNLLGALFPIMIQFPAERDVFLREENAGLYTTAAYFTGKSSVEMPFLLIFPLIQQSILYWMVGLNDNEGSIVVITYLVCILLGLVGNSIGSLFKDFKSAVSQIPMVVLPLIVFSGFMANRKNYLVWIGWLEYLNPIKYSFEALVRNDYSDVEYPAQFVFNNYQFYKYFDEIDIPYRMKILLSNFIQRMLVQIEKTNNNSTCREYSQVQTVETLIQLLFFTSRVTAITPN